MTRETTQETSAKKSIPIKHWPMDERPRERLLKFGVEGLSDSELLAIFLSCGTQGKSALDTARELIMHFGSMRQLLAADFKTLRKLRKRIGLAKYTLLKAASEIINRQLMETLKQECVLNSPLKTYDFLKQKLQDRQQEIFACLFLSAKNKVLEYKELFFGTINSSAIYPRQIVKEALTSNAAKVILVHNHPSGETKPSQADLEVTYVVKRALELVDIIVSDHVIIGNGIPFSFAKEGLL